MSRMICAGVVAGIVVWGPLASQQAVTRRPEPQHIRLLKGLDGVPTALQTAITRFVPQDPEADLVVDLVGVVHYGEESYYRNLNRRFRSYDAVLYELVADASRNRPVPGGAAEPDVLSILARMAQSMFGLRAQLDVIDYGQDNFVHADLSPRQMLEALRERGEDELTLALGITTDLLRDYNRQQRRPPPRPSGPEPELESLAELLEPGGMTRLKRSLARELVAAEGRLGRTIGTILIDDRNKAAMRVFQRELANGRRRIAIFYGAAHMKDFERRLVVDFGLRKKDVEWRTAWNLEDDDSTALGGLLKALGDQLSRDLQRSRRDR